MNQKSILSHILDNPFHKLKVGAAAKKTQNKEALRLYRDILKFSIEFDWANKNGETWRDIIRKSARKEFEIAKNEADPFMVMRMIMTSREAMQKTREKLNEEYFKLNTTFSERTQTNQQNKIE
ncbi:unnamed protein product (macronuclear) [Paramecium tetraurelia]|uniref:Complex 1 LYR protein domain-containing protein n=1 Tax=Paramecium tetraurelia TaxID=5888 RepID=A0D2I3_PARTE|nr:uncharacterized protein GSPATT00012758001 [Paramecium tetraurelia]CAK77250.1 unnamed protein product [Paramecium tetraurelia]|eukprot:XP_001444647.1 hypothetical protein (macronuclear) [Paramecium tetraurelia strain d4-2]